jgi:hypothetical protein
MTAQRILIWASSSASPASSSRILRWAMLSRSFSATKVGDVGDTGLPLNRLWAFSFDVFRSHRSAGWLTSAV